MDKERINQYIDSRLEYYRALYKLNYISQDDIDLFKERVSTYQYNNEEELHNIIDRIIEEYVAVRINNNLKFDSNEFDEFHNIKEIDISDMPYDEIDKMLFHFGPKKYAETYDKEGIKPHIGDNSKGIDDEPSIFFSKGVEGLLEVWDVWLKWRLDKYSNPKHQVSPYEDANEKREKYNSNNLTQDEKENYYGWLDKYNNKELFKDSLLMHELYDAIYSELSSSYYYQLDLKEVEEYNSNQIDKKKESALRNGYIPSEMAIQYGNYSDMSSPIVDKWNMQTIPGKDIVIDQSRIHLVTIDGNKDMLNILSSMYDLYKDNVKDEEQVKFDVLDEFIQYIRKETNNYQRK